MQKYLNKFSSRYNAKLTIKGDRPPNYKLNAKINGYLNVSKKDNQNKKEEFSIDLEGGLLNGNGSLKIKKLPLSAANIFLTRPRDFIGGLDMNLFDEAKESKLFSDHYLKNINKKINLPIKWDSKKFVPYNYSYFAFVYNNKILKEPPKSMNELINS